MKRRRQLWQQRVFIRLSLERAGVASLLPRHAKSPGKREERLARLSVQVTVPQPHGRSADLEWPYGELVATVTPA
ncbi:MAG: hypothetical protein ACXVUE_10575 [Solirubrobacteraceae bacterium]